MLKQLSVILALFFSTVAFANSEIAPTAAGSGQEPPVNPQTGMEFVFVPGGCFPMGSTSGNSNEKPVHDVCLSDFYIGKHEVTQGQWRKIMGANPSRFNRCGDNCPVEQVSWTEAGEFINRLNSIAGTKFRLPTEAEWEYACRSGGKEESFCGGNDIDSLAWHNGNSGGKTHPVGGKRPNDLGIFDMSGNVWEWVYDFWGEYPGSRQQNPVASKYNTNSVRRGGSWLYDASKSRAAWRSNGYTDDHALDIGFRLVLPAGR